MGEIADETDLEERLITANGDVWAVDARLPVDELAEATSVVLPDDQWDTVGGLILALAERVPEEGEEFDIEQPHPESHQDAGEEGSPRLK